MPGRANDLIVIPDSFWQLPDVTAALRSRNMGLFFILLQDHAGVTQTQIAIAWGTTQGKVSDLERGVGEVKHLSVFEQIADGLKLPDPARIALGLAPRSRGPQQQTAGKPKTVAGIPHQPSGAVLASQALDDELAAMELAQRASASDVSNDVCERIALTLDDLATAYPTTAPADLLPRVRTHLGYATRLLDGRTTLAQQRRLLTSGGWLSLLAATCLIDLHQDPPALAYLRTAEQLARETGQAEITGWVLETRAWMELTAGDYRQAVTLSQGAQQVAPRDGSAYIQATGQEGRAWARLGDPGRTRAALSRVEALAAALPVPDRPEHHFHYDPAKAEAYAATTLSWVGDPAAEQFARDVLHRLESPPTGPPRYRRASSARLDLSLALVGQGKHDEAAGTALQAVTSGYLVPSNYWRAREVIGAVSAHGVPEARDLADAYRAELDAARHANPGADT
jgi:tetratricopeptide (TPR) repeat protein